jgi:predicted lipoprotein with Yx(FWY)xxD motif
MKKYATLLPAILLAACASTPHDHVASAPLAMKDGLLVNAKGLTVYTFDKDVPNSGKSACNGDCAVKWPPVLATAGDKPQGAFTVVTRDDGRRQWAYKGKPVYTWPEDQEPGDKYGDNYLKVWHVIRQ